MGTIKLANRDEREGNSRVQYVTLTTLRTASTLAPSLITSGGLHIYHIHTMGRRVGSRKKTESTHHDRQRDAIAVAWPQEKGCKKNPMRPCDGNGKPPNRTFPEFKLINREERGERYQWGWCTPKCSRMQCVTLQPREWHPTKLSSVVHGERRACEQGGHETDSPQTFQEPKGIRTTTVDLAEIARDLSAKSSKQVNHAPEEGTNGPHNLCRAASLSAGKRAIWTAESNSIPKSTKHVEDPRHLLRWTGWPTNDKLLPLETNS